MNDRDKIELAFRLISGRSYPKNQWTLRWVNQCELTAFDNYGHELNMMFSWKGRLTGLVHWVPDAENPRYASRTPIYTRKREYVIDVLGGTHPLNLRWRMTQAMR